MVRPPADRKLGRGAGLRAAPTREHVHGVDPHTLEILVCPLTKTRLVLNQDKTELLSPAARLAFPIRKGVPLMCLAEARPLSDEEMNRIGP